jgi:PAS domain-containing protein
MPGLGYSAFSAFYLLLNLAAIVLVARSWHVSTTDKERARLGIIVVTHAVALFGGFTTDTILEALGVDFPKVGVLWASVWAIGLNIAMERFGFMAPFSPRDTGLLMDGFIERSMDGIVVSDSRGRVMYWNKPLEEMTGITAGQALGESLLRLQGTLVPP